MENHKSGSIPFTMTPRQKWWIAFVALYFAARFAAQYFFIRSDTAFLAAADHPERFRTDVGSGASASSLPGLKVRALRTLF
jgi:hypothetical protein